MPDYMYLMESRLSAEQRELVALVQELGQAQETNVYLTGGAVRGLITGMPIRDLDFTVEGNPVRLMHELEKRGARVVEHSEKLRQAEMLYKGEVDFSLAAARDDVFSHPGAKPEVRWSAIMDDLRRRDISINAIAISLNPASRGLLLDPTNGLADVEKREIRVLSMHSFTNRPVRLLRVLRYAARLEFRIEQRTNDWFALAKERGLHEQIPGDAVGDEVRQLAREERCVQVLKAWSAHGLLEVIHPRLGKRQPDYDGLAKLMKARESLLMARVTPRLFAPVVHYLLARLSAGERGSAVRKMEFRAAEAAMAHDLEKETAKVAKMLKGRKTGSPRDAYYYLEGVRPDLLAFILASVKHSKVLSKIRMYLAKWRPLKMMLPAGELEALGIERGPKFDKILLDLFHMQLAGKARNPQDRIRVLRNLAGIKPEPKKKEKEKEKEKEPKKKGKHEAPGTAAAPALKGRRGKAAPPPAELEGESEPASDDEEETVDGMEEEEEIPVPAGKRGAAKDENNQEEDEGDGEGPPATGAKSKPSGKLKAKIAAAKKAKAKETKKKQNKKPGKKRR